MTGPVTEWVGLQWVPGEMVTRGVLANDGRGGKYDLVPTKKKKKIYQHKRKKERCLLFGGAEGRREERATKEGADLGTPKKTGNIV